VEWRLTFLSYGCKTWGYFHSWLKDRRGWQGHAICKQYVTKNAYLFSILLNKLKLPLNRFVFFYCVIHFIHRYVCLLRVVSHQCAPSKLRSERRQRGAHACVGGCLSSLCKGLHLTPKSGFPKQVSLSSRPYNWYLTSLKQILNFIPIDFSKRKCQCNKRIFFSPCALIKNSRSTFSLRLFFPPRADFFLLNILSWTFFLYFFYGLRSFRGLEITQDRLPSNKKQTKYCMYFCGFKS